MATERAPEESTSFTDFSYSGSWSFGISDALFPGGRGYGICRHLCGVILDNLDSRMSVDSCSSLESCAGLIFNAIDTLGEASVASRVSMTVELK